MTLESHLKGKAIHKQPVRTETKMYLLMLVKNIMWM